MLKPWQFATLLLAMFTIFTCTACCGKPTTASKPGQQSAAMTPEELIRQIAELQIQLQLTNQKSAKRWPEDFTPAEREALIRRKMEEYKQFGTTRDWKLLNMEEQFPPVAKYISEEEGREMLAAIHRDPPLQPEEFQRAMEEIYRKYHLRPVVGSRGADVTCLEDESQKAERWRLEAQQRKRAFEERFPELTAQFTKAGVAATYGVEGDLIKITYSFSAWPRSYWWEVGGSTQDAWLKSSWEERSWNEQHNPRKATYTDDPNDMRKSGATPQRAGTLAECVATLIDDVRSLRHK